MNQWICDAITEGKRCRMEAFGVGGAVGLRAIGWYFAPGTVLCPYHRPDGIPCIEEWEDVPPTCSSCRGEQDAAYWQALMNERIAKGMA